ncbi:hypothetical protein ACE1TI_17285 [Alteribacillus sp. JSM 102045]|uniref:hypothetical protein n=1 Tax=Alteribacillus sp. JSM 102045 TaxID=1562101 RepID=UPI0035C00580
MKHNDITQSDFLKKTIYTILSLKIQSFYMFLSRVNAQRSREAAGAEILTIPSFPKEIDDHAPSFFHEADEYYRTARGKHENAPN